MINYIIYSKFINIVFIAVIEI